VLREAFEEGLDPVAGAGRKPLEGMGAGEGLLAGLIESGLVEDGGEVAPDGERGGGGGFREGLSGGAAARLEQGITGPVVDVAGGAGGGGRPAAQGGGDGGEQAEDGEGGGDPPPCRDAGSREPWPWVGDVVQVVQRREVR